MRLPYLSMGSQVRMRNDCAERTRILPVTIGCFNATMTIGG